MHKSPPAVGPGEMLGTRPSGRTAHATKDLSSTPIRRGQPASAPSPAPPPGTGASWEPRSPPGLGWAASAGRQSGTALMQPVFAAHRAKRGPGLPDAPGAAPSQASTDGPWWPGWRREEPPGANTLSRAACCQMLEAVLGLLILACSSVSYGSVGGYTGIPDLGSIYYYQYGGAYSGFSGPDGERARQLDAQFHRMKLPIARASMAVGGALMALALLLVLLGALRLPWRCPAWLLLECALDMLLALGLLPALYFYFHQLQAVYASPLCQEREQLYQSKGYQGFSCSLHGADIAAGLFGCLAALVLALSAGLAVRGFRTVCRLQEKPARAYEL
ncbi:PREDICTED: MARVEL domain-containing protein 3 [Gavialis gangeticus]|uniref:MARVEL domain-containing protein 3 n=1 Tax=Gavialis gangeticus TaxID=94835 RepID=UPI00092ECE2A|nr:PREDICTED: MARVEL domain-containing protein 3 [Gavialis gangeticus]